MAFHRAKQEYRVTGIARVPEEIKVDRTTHAFSEAQAILQIEKTLEARYRRVKVFWVGEAKAELTSPKEEKEAPLVRPVMNQKPGTFRRAPAQQLGFTY